mmetsp:Transcript_86265/g.279283  ORF Transcript_86265/g.279283 Transcript_86265/m.279283 type:complete len:379 (-) Transcript_86265:76-1212(-)
MARFIYVGPTKAGQSVFKNSPGFGKVVVEEEKQDINIFRLGEDGHSLIAAGSFDPGCHTNWLAYHPSNGHLYAVGGGKVHALKVAADGSLSAVSSADALGASAYLELSADGKWALVANFGSGSIAVLPILSDGKLSEATDSKMHTMVPNPALADRQDACHPHQIRLDKANKWALVCDLGADRVWVYAFDAVRGSLVGASNSSRHLALPEGAGPRHLDFHPNGRWVYVLCELNGNLVVCDWDAEAGSLTPKQSIYVLPEGVACSRANHSGSAHVLVSPDGRMVYATTRTDNQVVVFRADAATGCLEKAQSVPSCGICPRNFHLDYTSAEPRLRVGNQDSQNLVTYAIDPSSGLLAEPPEVLKLDGFCPAIITGPISPVV